MDTNQLKNSIINEGKIDAIKSAFIKLAQENGYPNLPKRLEKKFESNCKTLMSKNDLTHQDWDAFQAKIGHMAKHMLGITDFDIYQFFRKNNIQEDAQSLIKIYAALYKGREY